MGTIYDGMKDYDGTIDIPEDYQQIIDATVRVTNRDEATVRAVLEVFVWLGGEILIDLKGQEEEGG
jgi:hypothetical protein